jgi:hypothetical protein
MMMIKNTKLHDPGAYGSISILPTTISFYYYKTTTFTFDPKQQ